MSLSGEAAKTADTLEKGDALEKTDTLEKADAAEMAEKGDATVDKGNALEILASNFEAQCIPLAIEQ
jgi:hypothetical protein